MTSSIRREFARHFKVVYLKKRQLGKLNLDKSE
jgi:hypothetical protein